MWPACQLATLVVMLPHLSVAVKAAEPEPPNHIQRDSQMIMSADGEQRMMRSRGKTRRDTEADAEWRAEHLGRIEAELVKELEEEEMEVDEGEERDADESEEERPLRVPPGHPHALSSKEAASPTVPTAPAAKRSPTPKRGAEHGGEEPNKKPRGSEADFDEQGESTTTEAHKKHKVLKQEGGEEIRQEVNGSIPTGYITIGTPPKKVFVIFDTGSDKLVAKTWASVQRLISKVDAGLSNLVLPAEEMYNRQTSATYKATLQEMPDKNDETGSKTIRAQANELIVYGSGQAATEIGSDTVVLAGQNVHNFSLSEIVNDELKVLHQKDQTAGIMGLQHMKDSSQGESLFTRLRKDGHMYAFGYCRGSGDNGTFIWNDHSQEGHPVNVIGDIHWAVQMTSMKHEKVPTTGQFEISDDAPMISILEKSAEIVDGSSILPTEGSSLLPIFETVAGDHSMKPPLIGFGPQLGADIKPRAYPSRLAGSSHRHHSSGDQPQDPFTGDAGDDDSSYPDDGSSSSSHEASSSSGSSGSGSSSSGHSHSSDPFHQPSSGHEQDVETIAEDLCDHTDPKSMCAAVIDTGSNIIAGPAKKMKALTDRVKIRPDCGNLHTAPNVHVKLAGSAGDVVLIIPASAYVMQVEMPTGYGMGGGGGGPGDDSNFAAAGNKTRSSLWRKAFEDLRTERGIDLRRHIRDIADVTLDRSETLCMPAFTDLDANTQHGKLWILGTPAFQQYYTRFSWPSNAERPKIFFMDKAKSQTCNLETAVTEVVDDSASASSTTGGSTTGGSTTDGSATGTGDSLLSHKESQELPALTQSAARRLHPRRISLADLTFPRWALKASHV